MDVVDAGLDRFGLIDVPVVAAALLLEQPFDAIATLFRDLL